MKSNDNIIQARRSMLAASRPGTQSNSRPFNVSVNGVGSCGVCRSPDLCASATPELLSLHLPTSILVRLENTRSSVSPPNHLFTYYPTYSFYVLTSPFASVQSIEQC